VGRGEESERVLVVVVLPIYGFVLPCAYGILEGCTAEIINSIDIYSSLFE